MNNLFGDEEDREPVDLTADVDDDVDDADDGAEPVQATFLNDINGGHLEPADMGSEMRTSFIEYAMSVIVARALPDVRDGLKPVHRRILFAMNEAGITPNRPHKKSAWTVGEVIGKYHPHGDSAVYDAMVRLAQDFSMRVPLVDGHGNFGSVDGDPPAAMRYTESRMTRAAMEMLRDLDKETVDWVPNYDESLQEPEVLPSRFPNLLVNGSSGIAVGMATNIPPHNLGEVIDAVDMMIDNPDATVDELMTVLPGPDFPTGATIMGTDAIRQAYTTGRGSITVRAKAHVEQMKNGRQRLVFTEIPYQVNKGLLQEKIAQLVNEKRIEGISDLRDETNRKGMRLVIDLKQNAIPQVVLNNLYKHTQLQTTFGVINLALVDGVPRTLTLPEMLHYYIQHQQSVVRRRTEFDLKKARDRAHILQGLIIAVDNIDEVVHIIRSSADDAEAKQRLSERFGLDDVQCDAILEMRLRRLTGLQRQKLEDELNELLERIAYYEDLLAHEEKILGVIKDELGEIKEKFADKRRTEISMAEKDLDVEDLIAEEDMVVTITHTGYVKRIPVATYRAQKRGGKGVSGTNLKEDDVIDEMFIASTHDFVLFFSTKGKVYRLKVHELPVGSRQARGTAIVNLLPFEEGERIAAVISCRTFPDDEYLVFATESGMIKKTVMSAYDRSRRDGIIAINLKAGDRLLGVRRVKSGDMIIMATTAGKAILFHEEDVRATGRDTSGVRGITMKGDARVLGMEITNGKGDLFVITEKGYGKRTPILDYTPQNRGGQGVFTIQMTPRKGQLAAMKVVGPQHELFIITAEAMVTRVKTTEISRLGRATQGVKMMSVPDGDRVTAVARMTAAKAKPKKTAQLEGQETLDFAALAGDGAAAGGVADEAESVDIGADDAALEDLLDEE